MEVGASTVRESGNRHIEVTTCLYYTYSFDDFSVLARFVFYLPLLGIVGIFGLVGNTLACIVLANERPISSTSVFLIAQAVADNLLLVGDLLFYTLPGFHFFFGTFEAYRVFWELCFQYIWFFKWFSKTCSIFITVCVAAERYVAVCVPFKASVLCTKRTAVIALCVVSLFSFIFRIPLILGFETKFVYDPCSGSEMPSWEFTPLYFNPYYDIIYLTVLYILVMSVCPTILLVFFTYSILSTLRRARDVISRHSSHVTDQMKSTTTRVMAVVVVFLILETPGGLWQIMASVLTVLLNIDTGSIAYKIGYRILKDICYFLNTFNCVVNFYVYSITSRSFRRTFCRVFLHHHGITSKS
jgi:hypothetical protein